LQSLTDSQLLRYSRHIMLPGFDINGQQRVSQARVLLVGVGGLGSPVALYLTAAGVGTLKLVDGDRVDLTNLQRQVLFSSGDVGQLKVEAARARLTGLNPEVRIQVLASRLEGEALEREVAGVDVVVDATDNFATRFALNAACHAARKPMVSAAAIRMEAQVTVFTYPGGAGPCYRCLYHDEQEIAESCSETGVLGPLVGIIGSIQALEVLKLLAGMEVSLAGRLLVLDARRMEWRAVGLRADPACPVCGRK
jgi:adenylyltransferase/sulfurtransferase